MGDDAWPEVAIEEAEALTGDAWNDWIGLMYRVSTGVVSVTGREFAIVAVGIWVGSDWMWKLLKFYTARSILLYTRVWSHY